MAFLVTTTGVSSPVSFADLGGRTIVHPAADIDLSLEFPINELVDSGSIATALDAGDITIRSQVGGQVYTTSAGLVNFTNEHTITSHSDVDIVSPADNDVVAFDTASSKFKNQTPAQAGLAPTVHQHSGADITSGVVPDAQISGSSVSQHAGVIDHNSLLNYAVGEHRTINDAGTTTTDLWSGNKINAELTTITSGMNRRNKVINIVDNTAVPPTEVLGERYILDNTAGTVHANWDGALINDIVEFNGTVWVATTPVEGWTAYLDIQNRDAVFVNDGAPNWELRNSSAQSNLNDIGDVVIATPADNEVLAFDNGTGNFINQTNAEAGIADAIHNHVSADVTDLTTTITNHADVSANTADRHVAMTLGGVPLDTTNDTLNLAGQTLTVNPVTNTTDGAMIASDKVKLDAVENGAQLNTMTNVGVGGVTTFEPKVASDFQMRSINQLDTRITVALDAPNKKIDIGWGNPALQDLSDVAALAPVSGDALAYNGAQFAVLSMPGFVVSASKANTSSNIYLRSGGNAFMNLAPMQVPFNCDIIAISALSSVVNTWNAEVYKDDGTTNNIVANPNQVVAIVNQQITAAIGSFSALSPVALNAGDKIAIYCRGSSVQDASVHVWLRRRA